jgi:alkanesulfonate monooxygenase SsuD/methylene tetrahydromethanopterin reductase-like flavin-dependent oxidoreductase (luciferase family)
VRVLPGLWADEPFSYDGRCFSMPERNVLPKPLQKPHPPMWVTVTSPGTELDAADRGLGCLGVAAAGYSEQERRTREYHRRIRNCDPVSSVINDQVTTLNFLYCHEDPARAAETGMRMVNLFGLTNSHLLWTREAYTTRAYQSLGNLAPGAGSDRSGPGDPRGIPEGIGVGTPDRLVSAIRRWDSIGVNGINFLLNTCETVRQEEVLASLRLFAAEVMPRFREPASVMASKADPAC